MQRVQPLRLQASPEFKGIKTAVPLKLAMVLRFKPALNSKGLRQMPPYGRQPIPLQASPEFKGIKTCSAHCNQNSRVGFKPALNSKGLRLARGPMLRSIGFKPALNSKGLRLDFCVFINQIHGFKPALNSKGLRPISLGLVVDGCFKPALNSKGLRHGTQPQDRRHHWPDRFDCLPDQHPGAERGRGSRPRG